MKLDPRSTERLTKLLGMLGSDHAGERAAAGSKANALVREHGLTWADVIFTPAGNDRHDNSFHKYQKQDERPDDWRTMRDYCARRPGLLRSREHEFIDDIKGWRGALTEKQNAW